jgi:hypothetical protein
MGTALAGFAAAALIAMPAMAGVTLEKKILKKVSIRVLRLVRMHPGSVPVTQMCRFRGVPPPRCLARQVAMALGCRGLRRGLESSKAHLRQHVVSNLDL